MKYLSRIENRRKVIFGFGLVILVFGIFYSGDFPLYNDEHYGYWSIVPPFTAIILAFWSRDVISALFIGIVLGGVISGKLNIVQEFLIPSIGTPDYGLILLVYLWSLGGLIGMWTRTGGALIFAEKASRLVVRGRRSAKFFTWVMGLLFHQGGTISTVLTGATVRPVADKQKISHEELAYMVDSTASPAATIIPFNVWPIYIAGLVAGTIPIIENSQQAINFFIQSIPFNFYGIFALIITLLFAWEVLPWVPGKKMRAAIKRSKTTGELDRPGALPLSADELTEQKVPENYKPGLLDFIGPIGTLLGVAIIPYVVTFFILGRRDDPLLMIAEAFVLAVLIAISIAIFKGMDLKTAMDGFIDGCKGVTIGAIILALAVTLKEVADAVGTAPFVIEQLGDVITPAILPGILMFLCMLIAFSTGTSWGTYAVVFPIALPLAWAIEPSTFFIMLTFGAVVGGSVFGDQCSPISDTTILSSLATGCDLMDHVYTQFPLAISAAGLGAIMYAVLIILFL